MAGDMILDNIEEFVFDEDRVVTYKWLSRTLSLHVNQAKRKLEEFAGIWREKKDSKPITVTFFVSGIQETTSGIQLNRVAVVKEEDLENVKKKLKSPYSEHIYSIQKSTLKDTAALYQTDFEETKQNLTDCTKYSAIFCKAAQVRSRAPTPPESSQVVNERGDHPKEGQQTQPKSSSHVEKSREEKKTSKSGSENKSKKKGLEAFMTKPPKKPESSKDTKPPSNKEAAKSVTKQTSSKLKKGSLLHAFQASQNKTAAKKDNSDSSIPKTVANKNEREVDANDSEKTSTETNKSITTETIKKLDDSEDCSEKTTKSPPPKKEEKAASSPPTVAVRDNKKMEKKKNLKAKSKKASKRDISNLDSSDTKSKSQKGAKRRRVIQAYSSSSEEEEEEVALNMIEEEEEEMDDSVIPPTPPEPRSKVIQEENSGSSPNQEDGGRRRKKVWKKKRYVDEDGCMVTEKVFEYESGEGSDCEKEAEKPKNTKDKSTPSNEKAIKKSPTSSNKKSKEESPPSTGKKQTNLTSFFKKR